jgi:hypothetical protein
MIAHTTRRLDPPTLAPGSFFDLNAISPNGRYAEIGNGSGRFLADAVTGSVTLLKVSNEDVGITDDGSRLLTGFSLYDIASGKNSMSLSCPGGGSPSGDTVWEVRLDNPRFATVVRDGCGYQMAGYIVDLTDNTVTEAMPAQCYWNLANACVEQFAVSDNASHFAGIRLFPTDEAAAIYDNSIRIPEVTGTFLGQPRLCGMTASGAHTVLAYKGLYDYRSATNTTVLIDQTVEGDPTTAWCAPQSVSGEGLVAYTRSSDESPYAQVYVDSVPTP